MTLRASVARRASPRAKRRWKRQSYTSISRPRRLAHLCACHQCVYIHFIIVCVCVCVFVLVCVVFCTFKHARANTNAKPRPRASALPCSAPLPHSHLLDPSVLACADIWRLLCLMSFPLPHDKRTLWGGLERTQIANCSMEVRTGQLPAFIGISYFNSQVLGVSENCLCSQIYNMMHLFFVLDYTQQCSNRPV